MLQIERPVEIQRIVILWAIQMDIYLFSRDYFQFFFYFLIDSGAKVTLARLASH